MKNTGSTVSVYGTLVGFRQRRITLESMRREKMIQVEGIDGVLTKLTFDISRLETFLGLVPGEIIKGR